MGSLTNQHAANISNTTPDIPDKNKNGEISKGVVRALVKRQLLCDPFGSEHMKAKIVANAPLPSLVNE